MRKLLLVAMALALLTGITPSAAETWTITATKWEPVMEEDLPENGYAIAMINPDGTSL